MDFVALDVETAKAAGALVLAAGRKTGLALTAWLEAGNI